MNYSQYDIEDFVNDPDFQQWVLESDSNLNSFWENFMAKNPKNKETVQSAKDILEGLGQRRYEMPIERQLKLLSQIKRNVKPEDNVRELKHSVNLVAKARESTIGWGSLAIAMIVLIVGFLGVFGYQKLWIEDEIVVIEKVNSGGPGSKYFLPDGTKVFLNSESRIKYRADFGEQDRRLILDGEAFFEVAHDSLRPFVVSSGNINTTALGTSFNVLAYDFKKIVVTLLTGKVKVEDEKMEQSVYLEPGTAVTSTDGLSPMTVVETNAYHAAYWKDGIIYFDNTDFAEVVQTIERWYQVEVHVDNMPERALVCSGKFEKEYLSNLLQHLGFALGFEYTLSENVVRIKFAQRQ